MEQVPAARAGERGARGGRQLKGAGVVLVALGMVAGGHCWTGCGCSFGLRPCMHALLCPCLTPVQALSRAHIESVTLSEMLAAVNDCVDPDCRRRWARLHPAACRCCSPVHMAPPAHRGVLFFVGVLRQARRSLQASL
jgi:hypothetical protein